MDSGKPPAAAMQHANAILLHPWRFQTTQDLTVLMDTYEMSLLDLSEEGLRKRFAWVMPGELLRFIDRRQWPPIMYIAYGDMSTSSGTPVFSLGCVRREALIIKGPCADPSMSKGELAAAIWDHLWSRGQSHGNMQQAPRTAPVTSPSPFSQPANPSSYGRSPPQVPVMPVHPRRAPQQHLGYSSTGPYPLPPPPSRPVYQHVPRHVAYTQAPVVPSSRPYAVPYGGSSGGVAARYDPVASSAPRQPNRHDRQAAIQRMRANVIRLVQSSDSEGGDSDSDSTQSGSSGRRQETGREWSATDTGGVYQRAPQGQGKLEAWAAEAPARGDAVTKKPWDPVTSGPPPGLGREAAKVDEHELAIQALVQQVSAMWAGTQRARGDGTQQGDRRLPGQASLGPWAAQHMALTPQQQHGMMLMMMDEGEQGRHRRRTRRGRRGQGKRKRAAEARMLSLLTSGPEGLGLSAAGMVAVQHEQHHQHHQHHHILSQGAIADLQENGEDEGSEDEDDEGYEDSSAASSPPTSANLRHEMSGSSGSSAEGRCTGNGWLNAAPERMDGSGGSSHGAQHPSFSPKPVSPPFRFTMPPSLAPGHQGMSSIWSLSTPFDERGGRPLASHE